MLAVKLELFSFLGLQAQTASYRPRIANPKLSQTAEPKPLNLLNLSYFKQQNQNQPTPNYPKPQVKTNQPQLTPNRKSKLTNSKLPHTAQSQAAQTAQLQATQTVQPELPKLSNPSCPNRSTPSCPNRSTQVALRLSDLKE